jgi:non-heme chloroperoxidase
MRLIYALVGLSFALAASAVVPSPQPKLDVAGSWQGTLKVGSQDFRLVVQIGRGEGGSWTGSIYSIDVSPNAIPLSSIMLTGSILNLQVEALSGTYEGSISATGESIDGIWTQGVSLPLTLHRATPQTAWALDPSPHNIQFVSVDNDVKLEVLDWGGSGRPVVLLAGLGDNAHVFDKFAPKLATRYHVYGITRRGFGASTVPSSGYSADRLGDDVLAVLSELGLSRPILIGHSFGGEELSSVGSRHPERVAGLIYLDAAYAYAYYDRSHGDLNLDLIELQSKLEQLQVGNMPRDPEALLQELVETTLPQFTKDLLEMRNDLQATPPALRASSGSAPVPPVIRAIMRGEQKYSAIAVPILAIFAEPHDLGPTPSNDPAVREMLEARDKLKTGAQSVAVERGIPSARVVRLPHANHNVFRSNEADVLREINAFIEGLPLQ